ncbi:MAG TPA: hypothetical protein VFP91_10890 [Vicinamibacterales bacterium]|nr:hypothetical protein [Vicinamibacterales bacterium]
MRRFILRSTLLVVAATVLLFESPTVFGQWLKYPTAGVPRTADGKPNLAAPTPRTPDGKPDFSGIWLTADTMCGRAQDPESLVCGPELPMGIKGINFGLGLPGGLPYQPWLAALVKKRTAENSKDDPHVRCLPDTFLRAYSLPHLLKFVQTAGLLVMLDEMNASYRQVFTDGRPLPIDPTPSWQGYSSAKWDGDTLVVNSNGFRDDLWIDWNGSVITSNAKVEERIRRPDYGHLEVAVTVDDPSAYTKPWSATLHQRIALNTELVDEICLENEKSMQRMK